MGAGQFQAGGSSGGPYERAGLDPAWILPAIVPVVTPIAIQFDPQIRGFTQNADGSFVPVHPVDQRVVLLLWLGQGDVPSAPAVGTRIRKRIQRVAQSAILPIVTDEVNAELAPLLNAGDIILVPQRNSGAIQVQTSQGRTLIAVFYRNLRLDPQGIFPVHTVSGF